MTETCTRGCRIPGAHIPGAHTDGPDAAACPGCLHRPAHTAGRDTLTVCQDCIRRSSAALADLVDLWPDLIQGFTRPIVREPGASIHTSDITTVGDMVRPQVIQIVADIRDWIDYVARFAEPSGPVRRLHLTELRPSVALAAIRRQLVPLLGLQPGLDASLVDDILRYRRRAHDALSSGWMRRIPLDRTCPAAVFVDGVDGEGQPVAIEQVCGADLVAVIVPADFGSDASIQCARDPFKHTFPQSEWGELEDRIEVLSR